MQTVQTENEQKKEYLKGYRIHSRRVNRIESEIEEIRSMKIYPSMDNDGMPHSHNQEDLSKYAAELTEKEETLYQEGVEQAKAFKNIIWKINQLEDENERDVLFYRYIKSKSWWEIAELMGYSERWITELHGRALMHLKI
jgi:DNA-directed RNA polymerase specialized sigma subunit